MKRFLSLLLVALMLCVTAAPAMADDGYKTANLEAFADMMDDYGFTYEYSADGSYITTEFSIDCGLEKCDVWVWPYKNGLKVQADIPFTVSQRDVDELAMFSVMLNNQQHVGEFYMSIGPGYMGFEVFCLGYDHVISESDLYYALVKAVTMLELYGDGILAITDSGYTAEEAFAMYH